MRPESGTTCPTFQPAPTTSPPEREAEPVILPLPSGRPHTVEPAPVEPAEAPVEEVASPHLKGQERDLVWQAYDAMKSDRDALEREGATLKEECEQARERMILGQDLVVRALNNRDAALDEAAALRAENEALRLVVRRAATLMPLETADRQQWQTLAALVLCGDRPAALETVRQTLDPDVYAAACRHPSVVGVGDFLVCLQCGKVVRGEPA